MKILKKYITDDYYHADNPVMAKRTTARGILMHGNEILLIYTKRYNDYSFPGGGVDSHEDIKTGLLREIQEETGALDVYIDSEFGIYEEIMETYREGYDFLHMVSHYYICKSSKELGEANPEDYEVANGSVPVWVDLSKAIEHNQQVIQSKESTMGTSIYRETYVLEKIRELLK